MISSNMCEIGATPIIAELQREMILELHCGIFLHIVVLFRKPLME